MPRCLPAILALPLVVAGCHLTSVEAVQAVAADDLSCPKDTVNVTPAQEKDTFVAAGCGKKGTYVCEGWDSYNQKPICRQR
jgi:hypothetical protein